MSIRLPLPSNRNTNINYNVDRFIDEFNRNSNNKNIDHLITIRSNSEALERIVKKLIDNKSHNESELENLNENYAKLISITGNLTCRIIDVLKKPREKLQTLIMLHEFLNKKTSIEELTTLYKTLPENLQNKIYKNFWRVKGCPTPESKVPEIRDQAVSSANQQPFISFGEARFFDPKPHGAEQTWENELALAREKKLALELSITPSLILEQMIAFVSAGENKKAHSLFDLLPIKIQKAAHQKICEDLQRPVIPANFKTDIESFLTSEIISKTQRIKVISSLTDAAIKMETAVNSLVDTKQQSFLELLQFVWDPESSKKAGDEQANAGTALILLKYYLNEIAQNLIEILDFEPFVESTKDSIEDTLHDLHTRYPSLLRSRILFIFVPDAFNKSVQPLINNAQPWIWSQDTVATATASAATRILGGTTTVVYGTNTNCRLMINSELLIPLTLHGRHSFRPTSQKKSATRTIERHTPFRQVGPPAKQAPHLLLEETRLHSKHPLSVSPEEAMVARGHPAVGNSVSYQQHTTTTRNPAAAVAENLRSPSIEDLPRIFGIPPTRSIIHLNPNILRNCPKALTELVAEAIIKDWEVTSFCEIQSFSLEDAPVEYLELVRSEFIFQIKKLKEFIGRLQINAKEYDLKDVIEILQVKQKELDELHCQLMDYIAKQYLSNDCELFVSLPHQVYTKALVIHRQKFHRVRWIHIQQNNPRSTIIEPLYRKIQDHIELLGKRPYQHDSEDLDKESSFISVYMKNLTLSKFWLDPELPDVIKKITSYPLKQAFVEELEKDIAKFNSFVLQAERNLNNARQVITDEKHAVFITEIENLKTNLIEAKRVCAQIKEIANAAKIENNKNLLELVCTSPLDYDVVEIIKGKIDHNATAPSL